MFAIIGLLVAAGAIWWYMQTRQQFSAVSPVPADSVVLHRGGYGAEAPQAPVAASAPVDSSAATLKPRVVTPAEPVSPPVTDSRKRAPAPAPRAAAASEDADTVERAQAMLSRAAIRQSIYADSVAAESLAAETAAVAAATAKREADQRIADSIEAAHRAEADSLQAARDRQAALDRAAADSAAGLVRAAHTREERIAAGRNALNEWLAAVVAAANARNVASPVMTSGPPSFAAFVTKRHPSLSEQRFVSTTLTEDSSEASAEWVARWRTEFGTGSSRKMKAAVTVVRAGETWRVTHWTITEGAQ
jgi:hypothetical protein